MASPKRRPDMDWLGMETAIRAELATVATHTDTKDFGIIIQRISDLVGQYTGRGFELDGDWWKRWEGGGG